MARRQLTPKQQDFFDFIHSYFNEEGGWPTYREIVDQFSFRSPNSVTQNLQALVKKGYLERDHNGYGYAFVSDKDAAFSGIPIKGIMTAGVLQEAVEADMGVISLEMLFSNLDRMFAVRISGRSMIGEGIEDGDYVLLMDDDITDGGIGAVLYNGETTLKRIYRDSRGLRLEPANDEFSDVIIRPDIYDEITVVGKYVGHVNKTGIYKKAS